MANTKELKTVDQHYNERREKLSKVTIVYTKRDCSGFYCYNQEEIIETGNKKFKTMITTRNENHLSKNYLEKWAIESFKHCYNSPAKILIDVKPFKGEYDRFAKDCRGDIICQVDFYAYANKPLIRKRVLKDPIEKTIFEEEIEAKKINLRKRIEKLKTVPIVYHKKECNDLVYSENSFHYKSTSVKKKGLQEKAIILLTPYIEIPDKTYINVKPFKDDKGNLSRDINNKIIYNIHIQPCGENKWIYDLSDFFLGSCKNN